MDLLCRSEITLYIDSQLVLEVRNAKREDERCTGAEQVVSWMTLRRP